MTKIAYPYLSRKLENWLFLEFFFIHWKTVKVSQNDQVQMQTWFTSGFLTNGTELRSFSHLQILTWIGYSDLSRNLENWLILMFAFIPCETCESQSRWSNLNINMIQKPFLDEWNRMKNFQFWPKSHSQTLAENLKIDYFWCLSSFTVKLWKSVKMIKFKCKLDLQVVSWWMVQN